MALRRIVLRDFVIVHELELNLDDGFTVLTGETGAGKSILVDALQLALGSRADALVVRMGRQSLRRVGRRLLLEALGAGILALVVAPDAVVRLVERAGQVRAGVGEREAFAMAGKRPADMAFIDLYSCFPVAVELGCQEIGFAEDDPRGLTVTGGLPYFGGPGNNYVMHSIAEMMARVRAATALNSTSVSSTQSRGNTGSVARQRRLSSTAWSRFSSTGTRPHSIARLPCVSCASP